MALNLATLKNIGVFMRYAAEAGKLQSIGDVMAFAETLQAVNEEAEKLMPKKPEAPKVGEGKKS